jgi:hypothetical protein
MLARALLLDIRHIGYALRCSVPFAFKRQYPQHLLRLWMPYGPVIRERLVLKKPYERISRA